MSDHCGTTTEEGNAICVPGTCSCSTESKSISVAPTESDQSSAKQLIAKLKTIITFNKMEKPHVAENS